MDIIKFVNWAKKGHRKINIEFDTLNPEYEIIVWCYDYDLMHGTHVLIDEHPPSNKELRTSKCLLLKEEIAKMGGCDT